MSTESVEHLLVQCAKQRRDISYAEALVALGLRFSRPKMRELCRLLAIVDEDARSRGEPELAVLVVRSRDRLPGDGWWANRTCYRGEWTGEKAENYIYRKQKAAFDYWTAN